MVRAPDPEEKQPQGYVMAVKPLGRVSKSVEVSRRGLIDK